MHPDHPARPVHPRGLAGDLYWWSVASFHGLIFGEMIAGLSIAAEAEALLPADACRATTREAGDSHIEGSAMLSTEPAVPPTAEPMPDPTGEVR